MCSCFLAGGGGLLERLSERLIQGLFLQGSALQAKNASENEWAALADSIKGQVWDFESSPVTVPIATGPRQNGPGRSPLPLDGPPGEALPPGLHHGSFILLSCVLQPLSFKELCVFQSLSL